jgi:hypothetical protein
MGKIIIIRIKQMQPIKRERNFGENNISLAKVGKQDMATSLTQLGVEKDTRKSLQSIFKKLAKSDFWHDFNECLMQDLLDNTSLLSSLSFKERASRIAKIRTGLGGNPTVQEYFMEKIEDILPEGGGKVSFSPERKLLNEINVNFDSIEDSLKKWNQDGGADYGASTLPILGGVTPTYEGKVTRTYSFNAHPVKAYDQDFFLPDVFLKQTKTTNFVFMIDASHLSLTEIAKKITVSIKQLVDESTLYKQTYNFYILQSNENDSDPANKITDINIETGTNVNIYYLKDDGNTSVYPSTFGVSDEQNENLFSAVGIQSVRTDREKNIITATLSGKVNMVIDDLGEISKIDKASQKAVDSLIERDDITPECLSYFLLKRAGDWCQALCLLDKTRKYTVYVRQKKTKVLSSGKTKTLAQTELVPVEEGVSLQDLIDRTKNNITIALVTLDRILLSFALLLGINVFFSTKYINLAPALGGRSIHWSIFFKNMDINLTEDEKKTISEEYKIIEKSISDDAINEKEKSIQVFLGEINTFLDEFPTKNAYENIKEYIHSLHHYTYLYSNNIPSTKLTEYITNLKTYLATAAKLNANAAKTDADFIVFRNILSDIKSLVSKIQEIENLSDTLKKGIAETKYPNKEKYENILNELIKRFQSPGNIDFRKEISYNNFLEDIIKTLRQKLEGNIPSTIIDKLKVSEPKYAMPEFLFIDSKTRASSRKQDLIKRYIYDGIMKAFPAAMAGGGFLIDYDWKEEKKLDQHMAIIRYCFFKLRNKQILACNFKKYNTLINGNISSDLDTILIGLKQYYVVDKYGTYISILDNYLVTDDESEYFIGVETAGKAEAFGNFLALLENNESKEKNAIKKESYFLHLLMSKYILMRDRLLRCDKYYTLYLSLYQELNEEIQSLILGNYRDTLDGGPFAEKIKTDGITQFLMISKELQTKINSLFKKSVELKNELSNDKLIIDFKYPIIHTKSTLYDFLNASLSYLYYTRCSIFAYSKKYYTPTIENLFKDLEAAQILSEMKIDFKADIIAEFAAEGKYVTDVNTFINSEKNLVVNPTLKDKIEYIKNAIVKEEDKGKIIEKQTATDNTVYTLEQEVDNTMADYAANFNRLNTLADIVNRTIAIEIASGGGGGRKRKTRRSKKETSKRKTKKH